MFQLVTPEHTFTFGHPKCFNWSPQNTHSHLVTPSVSTGHPRTPIHIWSPQVFQLVTPEHTHSHLVTPSVSTGHPRTHTLAFGHPNCFRWSPKYTELLHLLIIIRRRTTKTHHCQSLNQHRKRKDQSYSLSRTRQGSETSERTKTECHFTSYTCLERQ